MNALLFRRVKHSWRRAHGRTGGWGVFILYRVSSHRCTLDLVGAFLTFLVDCAPLRRVEHTRKHEDRRIEMTFQVNGPAFFAPYTALCAFKETEKYNKAHVHFACMHGKSLVTMSAHLRRVEHTWRLAHRRIDMTFQGSRFAIFYHLHGLARVQRDGEVQ